MAFQVVMPRLGWNMEEGAIASWRKRDGDRVEEGEVLFEVESDKAVQEVEALESGILRIPKGSPEIGDAVPVGTVLAFLVNEGEAVPPLPPRPTTGAKSAAGASPATEVSQHDATKRSNVGAPSGEGAERDNGPAMRREEPAAARGVSRHAISPRARRVARDLGVDTSRLTGSGRTGRIVERDVRAHLESSAALPVQGAMRPPKERQRIAALMSESANTTAAVTLTTEVDATELVNLRRRFAEQDRLVPSYTAMLIKLVARALMDFPALNARQSDGAVAEADTADIGIAVDTERALLVPVVREAEKKSLYRVAEEAEDLVQRTRSGRVAPEEMRGGSFTITNLGMFGIDAFTPIINLPECAILGVGRIAAKPVVTDVEGGRIEIRNMMFLSLTFDHRIVDGAPAARFLRRISKYVQEPYLWLSE